MVKHQEEFLITRGLCSFFINGLGLTICLNDEGMLRTFPLISQVVNSGMDKSKCRWVTKYMVTEISCRLYDDKIFQVPSKDMTGPLWARNMHPSQS